MKKLLWCLSLMLPLLLITSAATALPVTDGLIIHLKADRLGVIPLDGQDVTLWPDISNNLLDGVDGTAKPGVGAYVADVPTYKRIGCKGLPAIHFDSANNTVVQALVSDVWTWNQANGVCVFILCTGGAAQSDRAVHVGNVDGANFKNFGCDVSSDISNTAGTGSGIRWNNGYTLATGANNPVRQGVWHASVRQVAQGGRYDSLIYAVNSFPKRTINSNQAARIVAFDAGNNVVSVGDGPQSTHWTGGTDPYTGDIAEVLVYNRQLSEAEMQDVLDYLNTDRYLLAAHNPSPVDASTGQGTLVGAQAQVTFTWETALKEDLSGVNPNVTQHYFYFGTDPNFAGEAPTATLPVGTTSSGPYTLNLDQTYYWSVTEGVSTSTRGANDPNNLLGPIWSFETKKSVPVIVTEPTNQAVFPGSNATFTIDVSSISNETYSWYRSADDATGTPGDDEQKGTDANSLTIPGAQVTDEGYYFCKVTNAGGNNVVFSNVARLGIKRNVARWTLDTADYDNTPGQERYRDIAGGHHVDPNVAPDPVQFIPGKLGQALDISAKPLSAGRTEPWTPTFGTSEFTVSAWVKWNGLYGLWPWQGLVCSRSVAADAAAADTRNWLLEITNAGILHGTLNVSEVVKTPSVFATGEWKHVVYTATNSMAVLYVDGVPVSSVNPATVSVNAKVQQLNVPTYFGAIGRSATTTQSLFNGVMDDVRIYNYAMSNAEVIDELYYDISGTPACVNLDKVDMSFDVAGGGIADQDPDCVIDMADFAELAGEWLNCGYYPQSDCP